jgi:hypothetical protein
LCNIKLLHKNCCPSLLVHFLFTSSIFSNVLSSVAPQASPSISHVCSGLNYIRHMTSHVSWNSAWNRISLRFRLFYSHFTDSTIVIIIIIIILFSSVYSATGVTMVNVIYNSRFYQTNYSCCRQTFFKTERFANNVACSKHWC